MLHYALHLITIYLFSVEVVCPEGTPKEEGGRNPTCYKGAKDSGQVMTCSSECLGGCMDTDNSKISETQNHCYSCKHYLSPMSNERFNNETGYHACWSNCSTGFLSVRNISSILTNRFCYNTVKN